MTQKPFTERDFTPEFCAALVLEHGSAKDAAQAIAPRCVNAYGAVPDFTTVCRWITLARQGRYSAEPRKTRAVISHLGREIDDAYAEELVAEHGSTSAAAKAIVADCLTDKGKVPAENTLRFYLGGRRPEPREKPAPGMELTHPFDPERTNRLAELLAKANIDPDKIGSIDSARVKGWGYAMKLRDAAGNEHAHEGGLHATDVLLRPKPDFPCLTQAPPITVAFTDVPRILRKVRTVFFVSDAQIGFIKGPNGLESIHDTDAVDVTSQLIAATSPDELVFMGDWIDNTAFSRWPMRPEYEGTAQASVDAASRIMAEMVSAAGRQCVKRVCVSGNHDVRFERFALANAMAFVGLKRANSPPDEWPVLSMKFLLRFDELGVEYLGQFPNGGYWVADNVLAIHEPQRKLDYNAHIVHGHDHKLTMEAYAIHHRGGRESLFQYSVGCICRVGTRSTDPTSLLLTQTPSDQGKTNWSQGNGVMELIDGKFPQHQFEHVHIREGVAVYRGQVFRSSELSAEAA